MNLFQLTGDILALGQLVDELDGDISDPSVEVAWLALAEELRVDEEAKLDGCVTFIRIREMRADAARKEAERYMALAKQNERGVEWMKARLKDYLILTGRKSIRTETGRTVAVQANGGVQALEFVDNLDPATIPSEFVIRKLVPDTEAIRKHIEEYGALPFAWMKPRTSSLRIR